MKYLRWTIVILGLISPWASPAADGLVTYRVTPQATDPAIARFNNPHYVVIDPGAAASADLLLFMPGSGGNPANVSDFLNVAAIQGYRVVSLSYNDLPAVVAVCPRDPDPGCSAKVRQKRIFGDDVTRTIDDKPAESIVNRLVKLLVKLDRDHRVTPVDAWFGAYHRKENTADLIARAYKALKIPERNIRVFTLEPSRVVGENPYHLSMVGNGTTPRTNGSPAYADDWRYLIGTSLPQSGE